MSTAVRTCSTKEDYIAWDRFVYNLRGAHYFQTYGWLKSYEPMGLKPYVLVYETDGFITGSAAFLTAKIPLLPWQIVIIPHGPIPANPDASCWLPLMERLDELCRQRGTIYAQLYPHELSEQSFLLSRLEELGFQHPAILTSRRFSTTPVTVDLVGKSEEDILKSFRKNTRYYVRRALKSNLVLRTAADQADFDKIYDLFVENGQLMGYRPRPRASLRAAWEWFAFQGWATLIQAWLDKTLVGATLLIFTGRTAYYLAGAVRRGFDDHCPAEFMQWHAIREALKRNLDTYDLVNTVSPGVSQFKEGFRPKVQSWHEPRTKLYHPLLANLAEAVEFRLRPLLREAGRWRAKLGGPL